jgi:seryl-tRNA synthetase
VPVGKSDEDNVEIKRWGHPPKFDFEPKSHLEILENLGLIDGASAAKTSGSGFFFLKEELVLLDLALQRFAIDFLVKKGFTLIEPPFMVNKRAYEAMIGNPNDFAEASYKIENEDLYLIPTAEYPLGGMFIDKVLEKKDLPIRLVGMSSCFRREVGTHGKYSKGLFRMHQFNKIEQFIFCLPQDSWKLHEELQKNSEELYQQLGLHYRVVNVCTGDIGAKAAKKYDIEAWMADGKFREVGSNSNCTDYQARDLNIKFREKEGLPPAGFIHTLNNTAIATSRTMIAIIEQFQQKDGSVLIPKVLHPYMNNIKILQPIGRK